MGEGSGNTTIALGRKGVVPQPHHGRSQRLLPHGASRPRERRVDLRKRACVVRHGPYLEHLEARLIRHLAGCFPEPHVHAVCKHLATVLRVPDHMAPAAVDDIVVSCIPRETA